MECAIYDSAASFQSENFRLPQIQSPSSLSFLSHFPFNSNSSSVQVNYDTELLQPLFPVKSPNLILPVECGINSGLLHLSKLCQGSKGQCIQFGNSWLTPNEFQFISGRVTAKDWKRSIRHNGKSLKLLISKGALFVHSPLCDCGNHFEQVSRRMELLQNNNGPNSHPHNLLLRNQGGNGNGLKRESRLTSIIDSLLISKANEESRSCSSSESESWGETSSGNSGGRGCLDSKGFSPPVSRLGPESRTSVPDPASTESGEEEHHHASIEPKSASSGTLSQSGGPPTLKSSRTSKKRVPVIKSERQSPESVRSSPSPSKPGSGGGSGAPSPPLKQMEQMMGRNYSDFMRSLAAKYNHANPNDPYSTARASSFNFDSRFLKPGAAAAAASILALQQHHAAAAAEKLPFPLIDMSSTQTLLSMVRSAAATANSPSSNTTAPTNGLSVSAQQILAGIPTKRPSSPLDLSSAAALVGLPKKSKPHSGKRCGSSCSGCSPEAEAIVTGWNVEDVCRFVGSIDLCAEYVQAFRDHSIDGSSLPLLTEEHLISNMNMKLGPALKFKSTVAKKLGNCPICTHCSHCHVLSDTK